MQTNDSPNSLQTSPHSTGVQANNYGASDGLMWASAVLSGAAFVAGIAALALVIFRLDDYADQLATEKRLQTQAIDELRVEANVSRKMAGLPQVNYQEHD